MSQNRLGMMPPCTSRNKNRVMHSSICGRLVIAVLCLFQQPVLVLGVRKTRLTWVNGIGYNLDHMILGQKRISELFGGKRVEFCHNPTAKASDDDLVGYLGDLTQAGTQKLGRVTEEVNLLVAHLKEAVTSVGKRGRVVHIAHSQGALVTALAAKKLSSLEMSKIEVVALGGAAAIRKTPQTPFYRCINYYAVNDPLLWVVPSAEQALRSGFVADDEFCFLVPRVGEPIGDHQLLGPTYEQALAWEGQRFQRTYQSITHQISRNIALFLLGFIRWLSRCLLWVVSQCCGLFETRLAPVHQLIVVYIIRPIFLLYQGMIRLLASERVPANNTGEEVQYAAHA